MDGGCTTCPTAFENASRLEHDVPAITYPVFVTVVAAHTSPTFPVIVNVYDMPGKKLSPPALHTYRVPANAWLVTTGAPIAAGWLAVAPTTTGDTVSVTIMFVTVTPPVFAMITRYVIPSPTCGLAGTCSFVTVKLKTGADTKKSFSFVYVRTAAHAVAPTTHAVLDTVVWMHTGPTIPVIVNVYTAPGAIIPATARLHAYCVPLAVCVTTAAGNPAGWSPFDPVTTGEIVSVTLRLSTVAVPTFATMIRYVKRSPMPGAAGSCSFATVMPETGGATSEPTPFVNIRVVVQSETAQTNAVSDTPVDPQTSPVTPVIVNV
jgi:hypothetical protein